MKLSHVALAGITAATFASAAIAGGANKQSSEAQDAQQQSSSGASQSQQQSSASQSGMQSPELVRQAQAQLANKGHDVKVDGKMGPQTQAALKDFQKKQGMEASGQLDQQTIAALGVTGEDPGSSVGSSAPGQPESRSEQPKSESQSPK